MTVTNLYRLYLCLSIITSQSYVECGSKDEYFNYTVVIIKNHPLLNSLQTCFERMGRGSLFGMKAYRLFDILDFTTVYEGPSINPLGANPSRMNNYFSGQRNYYYFITKIKVKIQTFFDYPFFHQPCLVTIIDEDGDLIGNIDISGPKYSHVLVFDVFKPVSILYYLVWHYKAENFDYKVKIRCPEFDDVFIKYILSVAFTEHVKGTTIPTIGCLITLEEIHVMKIGELEKEGKLNNFEDHQLRQIYSQWDLTLHVKFSSSFRIEAHEGMRLDCCTSNFAFGFPRCIISKVKDKYQFLEIDLNHIYYIKFCTLATHPRLLDLDKPIYYNFNLSYTYPGDKIYDKIIMNKFRINYFVQKQGRFIKITSDGARLAVCDLKCFDVDWYGKSSNLEQGFPLQVNMRMSSMNDVLVSTHDIEENLPPNVAYVFSIFERVDKQDPVEKELAPFWNEAWGTVVTKHHCRKYQHIEVNMRTWPQATDLAKSLIEDLKNHNLFYRVNEYSRFEDEISFYELLSCNRRQFKVANHEKYYQRNEPIMSPNAFNSTNDKNFCGRYTVCLNIVDIFYFAKSNFYLFYYMRKYLQLKFSFEYAPMEYFKRLLCYNYTRVASTIPEVYRFEAFGDGTTRIQTTEYKACIFATQFNSTAYLSKEESREIKGHHTAQISISDYSDESEIYSINLPINSPFKSEVVGKKFRLRYVQEDEYYRDLGPWTDWVICLNKEYVPDLKAFTYNSTHDLVKWYPQKGICNFKYNVYQYVFSIDHAVKITVPYEITSVLFPRNYIDGYYTLHYAIKTVFKSLLTENELEETCHVRSSCLDNTAPDNVRHFVVRSSYFSIKWDFPDKECLTGFEIQELSTGNLVIINSRISRRLIYPLKIRLENIYHFRVRAIDSRHYVYGKSEWSTVFSIIGYRGINEKEKGKFSLGKFIATSIIITCFVFISQHSI